ncbi:MAG: tRNA (cytidine(56)-2'-O)-methyltransferase [Methanomicrobiales archaeon]|jgi:tRNA (cytidine56-2'-O)-methyltransferase|nr:tRNA (cytidine(56)-2'-O)-methyltransferase [Methanomicrobiales archaeon]
MSTTTEKSEKMLQEIAILRIGHRPQRDQRVTTHVGLTARAMGCSGMFLASKDKGVVQSIVDVQSRFGGEFFVSDDVSWKSCIKEWKAAGGIVIHLTMFGLNLPDIGAEISRRSEKILIVIGAEKVPGEVYELADYNLAVSNQPHSEISSLAILLYYLYGDAGLTREFSDGLLRVIPCTHGKRVVTVSDHQDINGF